VISAKSKAPSQKQGRRISSEEPQIIRRDGSQNFWARRIFALPRSKFWGMTLLEGRLIHLGTASETEISPAPVNSELT
jgi:hypothetical protein